MPLLLFRSQDGATADTPDTKGTGATLRDEDQNLDGNETAVFRSTLGSVMYVGLDRSPVASFMQSPTKSAMAKLRRLVRYLAGVPSCRVGLLRARCTEVS